jgi:hypothetical protein
LSAREWASPNSIATFSSGRPLRVDDAARHLKPPRRRLQPDVHAFDGYAGEHVHGGARLGRGHAGEERGEGPAFDRRVGADHPHQHQIPPGRYARDGVLTVEGRSRTPARETELAVASARRGDDVGVGLGQAVGADHTAGDGPRPIGPGGLCPRRDGKASAQQGQ